MALFTGFIYVLDALNFQDNAILLFIHGIGHLSQIFPGWKTLFSKWLTETELDPWDRSTNQRCSMKKAVLKNFAIFTGKSLCLSLYLIKLQAFRSATLLKRDFNTGVFLWILRNLQKHLLWRTSVNSYFGWDLGDFSYPWTWRTAFTYTAIINLWVWILAMQY